ncbi:response regulator [Paenibacillus sp. MWE-103]|uniref:Response regulator n=1 Tax=Paenibacillus artemisiicola TaxID=1172618 RepID=A0ABS3W477_9BACL|nr:helix-turn-helix domain-containing protein [Paenibacillus artemisiicola]MBO7743104.1 response regulator [Paenibacillus artemisiicola]
MIKTLFVEDEYFVRQGFVHSLPWESYGIQIIGEADNGEAALRFLQEHEVDLLITDLTMPVKSGLELLHEAKELYPGLPAVVLTCHRDFDYLQEALRLGALDYIVKTRLDTKEIERSLSRIKGRLMELQAVLRKQDAVLLLTPLPEAKPDWPDRLRAEFGHGLAKAGESVWLITEHQGEAANARIAAEAAAGGWLAIQVTNCRTDEIRGMEKPLADAVAQTLPYRYQSDGGLLTVSLADAKRRTTKQRADSLADIKKRWQTYAWVFAEHEFLEWSSQVREGEPPIRALGEFLTETLHGWSLSIGMKEAGLPALAMPVLSWEQWMELLRHARLAIGRRFTELHYSKEVFASALRSLDIIRMQLKDGLHQGEVARLVGLSRSYFSQVFKETFGMSFNEYARACSIHTARKLLAETDYPIYWIAEHSGFLDERYFSRVFRECTGLLPSEFRIRQTHGQKPTD